MKKIVFVLAAFMMGILILTSCNKESGNNEKAAVLIAKNGGIDYWKQIVGSFEKECKASGLVPIVYSTVSDADYDSQLKGIADLDKQKYDIVGIAIAPMGDAQNRKVEEALATYCKKNPTTLIIVDTPIDEASSPLKYFFTCYVGTDNEAAGKELAKKMGGAVAASTLAVRMPTSKPTEYRLNGIKSVLGEVSCFETDEEHVNQIAGALQDKSNVAFLNGYLLTKVLGDPIMDGKSVYAFDFYEEFIEALKKGGSLKGAMVQNTFEMGRQVVKDILNAPNTKAQYVPTIYITLDNLNSEEAKPFVEYFTVH